MVSYNEVKSANASLGKTHETLTAVFGGATAGIGLATLKAFAKHIPHPKAFIIGRSRAKFHPELQNLKQINPDGEYTFFETDVTLIKNIDAVCEDIKSQLAGVSGNGKVDLLFLSQGFLNFGARENTIEGLDINTTLRYYGRVRFTQNLLPIMTPHARALSVLAGGWEGKLFENDLDLETHYSFMNTMAHFTTTMTLAYDKLAEQNPEKSFLHVYPGLVDTGIVGRHKSGLVGWLIRLVEAVLSWFAITPEEAGERMLHYATSEQFARGSWSLDWDGTPKAAKALVQAREKGMGDRIVEHNLKMFERATSR